MQQPACGNLLAQRRLAVFDAQHGAVLQQEHLLVAVAHLARQLKVRRLVARLAMHRRKVARLQQANHQLQLLLARVPRHMHRDNPVVVDLRAEAHQAVHRAPHEALVARNRRGGQNHRVAWGDFQAGYSSAAIWLSAESGSP
jgi:hypothetical protein